MKWLTQYADRIIPTFGGYNWHDLMYNANTNKSKAQLYGKKYRIRILYPRHGTSYLHASDILASLLEIRLEEHKNLQSLYTEVNIDYKDGGKSRKYQIDPKNYAESKESLIFQDIVDDNCLIVVLIPAWDKENWQKCKHGNYFNELNLCVANHNHQTELFFCEDSKVSNETINIGVYNNKNSELYMPILLYNYDSFNDLVTAIAEAKEKSAKEIREQFLISPPIWDFIQNYDSADLSKIYNKDVNLIVDNIIKEINERLNQIKNEQ